MNEGEIFVNVVSKVTKFQPSNLITSPACSRILWTYTGDAMEPLKCTSMDLKKVKFDKMISMLQNNWS